MPWHPRARGRAHDPPRDGTLQREHRGILDDQIVVRVVVGAAGLPSGARTAAPPRDRSRCAFALANKRRGGDEALHLPLRPPLRDAQEHRERARVLAREREAVGPGDDRVRGDGDRGVPPGFPHRVPGEAVHHRQRVPVDAQRREEGPVQPRGHGVVQQHARHLELVQVGVDLQELRLGRGDGERAVEVDVLAVRVRAEARRREDHARGARHLGLIRGGPERVRRERALPHVGLGAAAAAVTAAAVTAAGVVTGGGGGKRAKRPRRLLRATLPRRARGRRRRGGDQVVDRTALVRGQGVIRQPERPLDGALTPGRVHQDGARAHAPNAVRQVGLVPRPRHVHHPAHEREIFDAKQVEVVQRAAVHAVGKHRRVRPVRRLHDERASPRRGGGGGVADRVRRRPRPSKTEAVASRNDVPRFPADPRHSWRPWKFARSVSAAVHTTRGAAGEYAP